MPQTAKIDISESVVLPHHADVVWGYVEDYSNDVAWRRGLAEMTPSPLGPPAIGTSVHEVLRFFGTSVVTDSVVTSVGPGLEYRFEGPEQVAGSPVAGR